ncbi:integrase arm-type DNA-binding domain-containing protein [Marilutibacter spongiae]|uniref:integrase arm-type DNA-binding domain-containing protein n=1 Tax=Marilutibacter spongiae TaxID=2025720 RepID=UPI003CCDB42E
MPAAQLLHRHAGFAFTQETDDLFFGKALLHVQSPSAWGLDSKSPCYSKVGGRRPDTSLADARERRDAARKLLAAGIDFGEHRKAVKAAGDAAAANSFEVVAREWFAKQKTKWADSHADGSPGAIGSSKLFHNRPCYRGRTPRAR